MTVENAVIVCGPSMGVNKTLLGLSIGERLLLALKHYGVKRISFIGDGPRPQSSKVQLDEVAPGDLTVGESYFLLPNDAVLTVGWLKGESRVTSIPVKTAGVDSLDEGAPFEDESVLRANSPLRFKHARKQLLLSLRKPIDGITSRFLNRRISLAITPSLIRTGLSPNTFTFIFMLLGLLSAYFATQAHLPWMLILAGGTVQAQSILDGCDGEMARLTYRFSKSGNGWIPLAMT